MQPEIIILIAVSLVLSGIFSGVEIAFVTANKLKIELDKNKGFLSAQILSWFNKNASRFIVMLLVGNNIALVIYGINAEKLLLPYLNIYLPEVLQTQLFIPIIQTIIATIFILFLAEFIPKVLFRINSNGILSFFAIPMVALYTVLFPLVLSFIKISEWILKYLFKYEAKEKDYSFTSSDLDHFIREFNQDDKDNTTEPDLQIFQNAIDFKDVKVRECMIHRTEILGFDIDNEFPELKKLFVESGHSKIVLYHENIDNIIGYAHSFDLFQQPSSVKAIQRDLIYVPETMQANYLLNRMIKQNQSIAVVLDEFGGTSGMVTLEDLMEEIFGEIEDEFDTEDLIEKIIDDTTFVFSSKIEIDYINQKYNLRLDVSDEYETLGGFIISSYESIPKKGERIFLHGFEFEILQATENKIELVQLRIISEIDN